MLALLLLPSNRAGLAWWVLIPLALMWLAEAALKTVPGIPSGTLEFIGPVIPAVAVALAALWLLAGSLAWKHRFLSLLGALGIACGAALLAFLPGAISYSDYTAVPLGIMVLVAAAIIPTSLTLAGLLCRGRWGVVRVFGCTVVGLFACVGLLVGIGGGMALLSGEGMAVLGAVLMAWLTFTAITFGLVLPFLLLSAANSFYRARLCAWLHLQDPNAPGMPGAAPPIIEETAPGPAAAEV